MAVIKKTPLQLIIAGHGDTQAAVSDMLGVTHCTGNRKIAGKADFWQREIRAIAKRYDMDAETVCKVFDLI